MGAQSPRRMHKSDYLRALLEPTSIALVGASGKPGSDGRIVLENVLGGGYQGALHVVNPGHRRVLARRSFPSIAAVAKPIDLALIVTPTAAVAGALDDAVRAGVKAAIIFSPPPADDAQAQRWRGELVAIAGASGIRMLGPHSFGVVRTETGLNATLGSAIAHGGRLALVAQSGAVCAAMLDFAWSAGIGFSTVVALGGAIDVGFGEWLDVLIADPATDGILLYTENIGDARRFLSALRAAARTKPVVVLRAGRSMEPHPIDAPSPDAVFDAAMRRAGTVRVKTYTQLFAAARILAMNRIAHGDRLAIVANGHGPGTLAADSAADRGIVLAELSAATRKALSGVLPPHVACANPIDVHWDAPPMRIAAAVDVALSDPNVDAALVLHVPRPSLAATDAARAVADVARRSSKPVLAAWLGAIDRAEATGALEAGHVANFYTPENAIDAFSFLAAYRHHQAWLLEVPPPQPEPRALDAPLLERVRTDAVSAKRSVLTAMETRTLLTMFSLPVPPVESADTLAEVLAIARRMGYPVTLHAEISDAVRSPVSRAPLRDGRMLARAWARLQDARAKRGRREPVIVAKEHTFGECGSVAIGIATDATFGPVVTFGAENAGRGADVTILLPPLNERIARDMIRATRRLPTWTGADADAVEAATEALARVLVQVSALACAAPWVRQLALDPVRFDAGHIEISGARVVIDPSVGPATAHYSHMAIHPYPVELVTDITLPDGARLHVRPIRPEDAALESAFVAGLSEETRYFRFFYQLNELTPSMLARFTQVDYDREMAFVAVDESAAAPSIVGVARYIMVPDRQSAEFAVVVADAWHGRGVARALMRGLVACAKARGLSRLEGFVLRNNRNMLRFTEAFGFRTRDYPDDPEQVEVVLDLTH